MQLAVRMFPQKIKIVEAGRGAGKSTVLADVMSEVVHDMPRSTNFLQGETFQQILTRTLPSTIESLTTLGYVKDLHYFVGRKPPQSWNWKAALQPPEDPTRAIFWYTGACYLLFSQDTSSRGPNTASGMADEFALLDPVRFQNEAQATLRLNPKRFGGSRYYLSQTYVTSIPRTQRGRFLYQFEEAAMKTPDKVAFIRASSFVNKENLPAQWFDDMARIMSKYDYDIEIRNIRPRAMKGGYYPLFSEKDVLEGGHTYTAFNNDYLSGLVDNGYNADIFKTLDCRQDADVNPYGALDIALDYGGFNCIVTGQESLNRYRFLSAMSVESPKLTQELVEDWCAYYKTHQLTNKEVNYYYDATAKAKDGRAPKAYYEIVVDTLEKNGWIVYQHDYGRPPYQKDKYNFWSIALRNNHPSLPHVSWNKHNCKFLIESITKAEAREGADGIEKIKTDEKNKNLDQRYTTHFSDACDMLMYYKYGDQVKETGIWLPPTMLTTTK